jgi:Fanconi anemia group M protein
MEQISNILSISKEKVDHQQTLETYSAHQDGTVLIVDHREYKSTIARLLSQKSLIIKPKQLDVGDYIVSSRIGVERKTVDDFLQSLISGKLFDQLHRLRGAYPRPILILEGEGLFTKRNVNHNAIYGSLIAICVDFGIPILKTQTPEETADLLAVMVKREQQQEQKPVVLRGEKPSMTLSERQRFVVEGLPLISSVMAKRLLQHFGSIPSLVNASQDELQEVFGVGKRIANEIYSVLHEEYIEE